MKDAANEMFEDANYVGSIKLFSQLLSTYPKDPSYNYKYGACILFGSRDKDDALKYLIPFETSLTFSPVSPFVNSPKNNSMECIKPLDNLPTMTLF